MKRARRRDLIDPRDYAVMVTIDPNHMGHVALNGCDAKTAAVMLVGIATVLNDGEPVEAEITTTQLAGPPSAYHPKLQTPTGWEPT